MKYALSGWSGLLMATVFSLTVTSSPAVPAFERVDAFTRGPFYLSTALAAGPGGVFYGTSHAGGTYNVGTLFKVTSTGTVTVLVNFDGVTNGGDPQHLSLDKSGNVYATTATGGAYDHGTIVKVTPAGQVSVVDFNLELNSAPASKLVEAADGNLYGTATKTDEGALVYRMTPEGVVTKVATMLFPHASTLGPLTIGADGNFYAVGSQSGLVYQYGTICRITPAGETSLVASFNTTTGTIPGDELLLASDGNFYGTTGHGPAGSGTGGIFRMTPGGELTSVATLDGTNGLNPYLPLCEANGWFYGTTNFDSMTVYRWKPGSAVETVRIFTSAEGNPAGGLVAGPGGALYGLTSVNDTADGALYKLTTAGAFSVTGRFQNLQGTSPQAALTLGSDGILYSTTLSGGKTNGGTAFRVTKAGKLSKLADLPGNTDRGPWGMLAEGKDGKFVGMLASGNGSEVFRMTKSGSLSIVASLGIYAIGEHPAPGLVPDGAGNFIGTAALGSAGNSIFMMTAAGAITQLTDESSYLNVRLLPDGHGGYLGLKAGNAQEPRASVFRLTPGSAPVTVGYLDPVIGYAHPVGGLVTGPDGHYYGMTSGDGAHARGTVYRITSAGVVTKLVDFDGANGSTPLGELVAAPDGWLYGTTYSGGEDNRGTVFRVSPAGVFEKVTDFDQVNGAYPVGGLAKGADGNLYGVTSDGGTNAAGQRVGGGQIFRLRLGGEPPLVTDPVEVDPNAGPEEFLFTAMDGDASNTLSLEEWQRIYVTVPRKETLFTALDTNHNGVLDFTEFHAAKANRSAARTWQTAVDRTVLFLEVDEDEDNMVNVPYELAKMWKPGTPAKTIESWSARNAGGQSSLNFYEWLQVKSLPSTTVYGQAKAMRAERAAVAAQLDGDDDGKITRIEFSHLYKPGTKAATIDAGWQAATGYPRGVTPPDWIWEDDFVEAPKLPKLVVF